MKTPTSALAAILLAALAPTSQAQQPPAAPAPSPAPAPAAAPRIALKSCEFQPNLPAGFPKEQFGPPYTVKLTYYILLPKGLRWVENGSQTPLAAVDAAGKRHEAQINNFFIRPLHATPNVLEVPVSLTTLPATGALSLTGEIPLTLASGTQRFEVPPFALKEDASFNINGGKVTVTRLKQDASGDTRISLKGKSSVLTPTQLEFTDAQGTKFPAEPSCFSTFGDTTTLDFQVKGKLPAQAGIVMTCLAGFQTIKIPVKTVVMVGQQQPQ